MARQYVAYQYLIGATSGAEVRRRMAQHGKASAPPTKPAAAPKHLPANRYINFYAADPSDASKFQTFDVLPGDTPPTIVGGYAKQTVVDRPLQRGLTIFQGYDPATMQLSVRFMSYVNGSWDDSDAAGGQVETDVAKLEWMAGKTNISGAPPFVYLSTADSAGTATALIPFGYQSSPTTNVPAFVRNNIVFPWVITDLQWDNKPERNRNGYRVRQDATLTVMEYKGLDKVPSVAHRSSKKKPKKMVSRPGADTALSIAEAAHIAPTSERFAVAHAIGVYPGNRGLHIRSRRQKIPHGKTVLVPFAY